jgi:hypothetical protein
LIEDFRQITEEERTQLINDYYGDQAVAYFIVLNPSDRPDGQHPLFDITQQLKEDLSLHYPLDHPMEGHPEAVSRFGPADGTLKVYDLNKDAKTGYREQLETSEMFATHNDGLGYGGSVQTVVLFTDSAPLWGGYTFFQNFPRLALDLAKHDYAAFQSLFLPDAIIALRPRGKGAIKVTSPVLFLNEQGEPQVFFRVSTGEYQITWRSGLPALDRAAAFLNHHACPFASGSSFVHFSAPGHGCFIRNRLVVHGRTPFIDGAMPTQRRVLARKWFMTEARHTSYKHVPGIYLLQEFASIFPEWFGPSVLEGEWSYDPSSDKNIRVK